ncbi:electron transfer flavoprotein alpha subunit [Arcanobacterium wilhelmae]|uniref:Electron transfer flavoprotein alpha subunit n=1 Tax=Arcanobacterium wilhelmae TaxID=1803177 RepID=A0ABT9N9D8_9ACTO|nr:electron transfer flavoprotein subunit alpha/FixB family protein [Arcanobacterium wilhelmae]MDP9800318.1 electron transfer flavoprotein alpha subunit [Arcanobacterium wilhelmae]WFN89754.1 electron transfer flavoprotein subunit alpha/FixB family protein [Arcanobacterium wilhelmae]
MTAWIITTSSNISHLLSLAGDAETTAIVIGDAPIAGVHRALRFPLEPGVPAESLAGVVAQRVAASGTDVVLAENTAVGRVIAGAIAATLGAPVVTGATAVGEEITRIRYGLVEERIARTGVVVLVADGGEPAEGAVPEEETVTAQGYAARVAATNAAAKESVDLKAAKRIVGVGRGFENIEDLAIARDFAHAIDAQIGATRPLVDGTHWFGRDQYLGISGHVVAPDVYVAAGVSGQIQHTAGIAESGTIIVINDDELSPIFELADYGIVGDLYEILPALAKELQ